MVSILQRFKGPARHLLNYLGCAWKVYVMWVCALCACILELCAMGAWPQLGRLGLRVGAWGLRFRVWDLRLRFKVSGLRLRFKVWGFRVRV